MTPHIPSRMKVVILLAAIALAYFLSSEHAHGDRDAEFASTTVPAATA